jgi:hypothetical protein
MSVSFEVMRELTNVSAWGRFDNSKDIFIFIFINGDSKIWYNTKGCCWAVVIIGFRKQKQFVLANV